MEVGFRYAVVTAHVPLSLVPKVLNAVDMAFLFDECFRMIDTDVVELRAARTMAGLTQRGLGAALGVDERQIRFWERRIPTNPHKVARIEQALLANGVALFTEPTAGARFA